jgi:hypothetical protein
MSELRSAESKLKVVSNPVSARATPTTSSLRSMDSLSHHVVFRSGRCFFVDREVGLDGFFFPRIFGLFLDDVLLFLAGMGQSIL